MLIVLNKLDLIEEPKRESAIEKVNDYYAVAIKLKKFNQVYFLDDKTLVQSSRKY